MNDCPDCGAPESATGILGFACEHERCPILAKPEVRRPLNFEELYRGQAAEYKIARERLLVLADEVLKLEDLLAHRPTPAVAAGTEALCLEVEERRRNMGSVGVNYHAELNRLLNDDIDRLIASLRKGAGT